MLDRNKGAGFDHDPSLDRPLKPETSDFLQKLRTSKDFDSFLLNQLRTDKKEDGSYLQMGELGVWGQGFVDIVYGISTPADADRLFLPWQRWSKFYSELEQHSDADGDNYETIQKKFAEAGIPADLKDQMRNMSEDNFRSNALSYLFRFIRTMKESIDMMEGLPRQVSAETISRVQRITGKPLYPEGGLTNEEGLKPDVRRIKHNGKHYFAFYLEGEKPYVAHEDKDGDSDWERWNQMEAGTHISTVKTGDIEIDAGDWGWVHGESGTVYGYSLMGAREKMLFQPSVGNIALLVKDDKTSFIKSALVKQVRLDTELQANQ